MLSIRGGRCKRDMLDPSWLGKDVGDQSRWIDSNLFLDKDRYFLVNVLVDSVKDK